jgi:hypothetical protein
MSATHNETQHLSLMMEAVNTSETSVNSNLSTRRNIPEDYLKTTFDRRTYNKVIDHRSCVVNTLSSHLRGAGFKFRAKDRFLTEVFVIFLSLSMQIPENRHKLDNDS